MCRFCLALLYIFIYYTISLYPRKRTYKSYDENNLCVAPRTLELNKKRCAYPAQKTSPDTLLNSAILAKVVANLLASSALGSTPLTLYLRFYTLIRTRVKNIFCAIESKATVIYKKKTYTSREPFELPAAMLVPSLDQRTQFRAQVR